MVIRDDGAPPGEQKTERKERVLHTRVPESLDEELKVRAAELGTSVSNLVRNVLQNAFEMVGDIVEDASRVARSARGPTASGAATRGQSAAADSPGQPGDGPRVGWVSPIAGPPGAPELLGYQTLTLAVNAVCQTCNGILVKGDKAALAVFDRPAPRTFVCPACAMKVSDAGGE